MKANELRIGNYVYGVDGFECEILSHEYLTEEKCSLYNPIPLTPEILERCGFATITSNADGGYNFWGKEIDASVNIDESGECFRYVLSKDRSVHIIYLHQLQNLYFSLTGEELEVNL